MKLLNMATFDLHEARGAAFIAINESYGRVKQFNYQNFKHDPRPKVLVLGRWHHPTSGNNLTGGINLNYLNQRQIRQLQNALPQILRSRNLRQRYWAGRRLLPGVFTSAYRTYNNDHIDAVNPGTLKFGRLGQQAQPGPSIDKRQELLAKLANLMKKERERVKQSRPEEPQGQQPDADIKAWKGLQQQARHDQQALQPQVDKVPHDDVVDISSQPPPPQELDQERRLPLEPRPDETIEGQTQAQPIVPIPRAPRKPRKFPVPKVPQDELGLECKAVPGIGLVWSSPYSYRYWHSPERVKTIHPELGKPLLEANTGPVLAVYDIDSGKTIIDRAADHAALIVEAGWDYDTTIRFIKEDGRLVIMSDLPDRLVERAKRGVCGLTLL